MSPREYDYDVFADGQAPQLILRCSSRGCMSVVAVAWTRFREIRSLLGLIGPRGWQLAPVVPTHKILLQCQHHPIAILCPVCARAAIIRAKGGVPRLNV